MTRGHVIDGIVPGSIAEELELQPGDELVSINGQPVIDILDYDFLCKDEYLDILIRRGEDEAVFEVEKDLDDDLGLIFDNGLMDDYRSCRNKCIFCFIDQMPPGMRETLYFKDDDSRLSFLQGNYVTLTNISDSEIDRIIRYRLSPINISVHTMDPDLRCRMLNNRFAGESLKKLDRLYEAGIEMNGQIVMCSGINDGDELDRTIGRLCRYLPHMQSLSVVPVGLTKYREGLARLTPVTSENASRTIDIVEKWQSIAYEKWGSHFVHASDEFYLLAGRELPDEDSYDGYPQLENGVGMLRLLREEFTEALSYEEGDGRAGHVSIATGRLPSRELESLAEAFNEKYPNIRVDVYAVRNDFFGETITVSGLVTGRDLISQLRGRSLGDRLLIPVNMLRSGEDVFLDDVHLPQAEEELGTRIEVVGTDGSDLLDALLGRENTGRIPGRYELPF